MGRFFLDRMVTADGQIRVGENVYSAQEVIALLKDHMTPERNEKILRAVSQRNLRFVPVLENLYDRGNISAVMRTAEGMGVQNMHLIHPEGSRFKEANRVTKGADKWVDVREWKTSADCVAFLKERGFQICATTLEGGTPIGEIDFSRPTAAVFGNEKEGVSREMLEMADARVFIPMPGFTQSFNISVAAALFFYHVLFSLKSAGPPGMTEEEMRLLQALFYIRSVESSEKILKRGR